ncbi:MAG TPA: TonB-dependent receptor, partial [Deltaproteobacteria bacterium]|nr:TonB-dependent receptor [Deltaproteobacteria bacterium]
NEDDPFAGVEEMVVVGTGSAALLQDTAISVSAFDQQDFDALGVKDIGDLAQFTPNLEIRSPFASTNPTLFIRGVGLRDFNANSSGSVAVYNDGIYMNSPAGQLAQLFDTEGVEVFRGPQGTLYGRNASAGAILVRSRRPTGIFDASMRFDYGRFNEREVEAAFEVPLVDDMLSIRIAGRWRRRSGYVRNRCADASYATPGPLNPPAVRRTFRSLVNSVCFNGDDFDPFGVVIGTISPVSQGGQGWIPGEPGPTAKKLGDQDNWAARMLLRFQPTGNQDWLLNVHGGLNRSDARAFQQVGVRVQPEGSVLFARADASGYRDYDNILFRSSGPPGFSGGTTPEEGDPFSGDYNFVGRDRVDLFGASLNGEITFGDFVFRTITGYEYNKRDSDVDLDASPYLGLEPNFTNDAWQISQEFDLKWDADTGLKWEGGVYFLHESLHVDNEFNLITPIDITKQVYDQKTYHGSIFTNFVWDPSELIEIEAGMRWNFERRTIDLEATLFRRIGGQPPSVQAAKSRFNADAPTGNVTLSYLATEDITFYLKYSVGWKAPHINGLVLNSNNTTSAPLLEPVDPETVNAVEFGYKTSLFDSRLRLNGAFFYYDYDQIQIFQNRNAPGGVPVPTLINANDAELYGVEMDVTLHPLEGWAPPPVEDLEIFFSWSWLGGSYIDFTNTVVVSTGLSEITRVEDFSGNQLINAPEFSFVGYAQWPLSFGDRGTITPRFDWSFKDQVFFSPENVDYAGQKPLWLLNLRVGYRSPDGHFEVAGWVRNLTDEVYRLDAINLTGLRLAVVYAIGDPRTYGLSTRITF